MFRTLATAALLAVASGGIVAPAQARHYYGDGYYRGYDRGYGWREARRHGWGRDQYGYRCHDRGNGGLAIGAIAGGLLGNQIAGRGDRTLGTVLGAAGGGLIGRSIDRHDGRC